MLLLRAQSIKADTLRHDRDPTLVYHPMGVNFFSDVIVFFPNELAWV